MKLKNIALSVLCLIALVVFMTLTNPKNPTHPTTWNGIPAYGLVSDDGKNYTFFSISGRAIVTLPCGEAVHLH